MLMIYETCRDNNKEKGKKLKEMILQIYIRMISVSMVPKYLIVRGVDPQIGWVMFPGLVLTHINSTSNL